MVQEPGIFTRLREEFGLPPQPPFLNRYSNYRDFKTPREMLEFEMYWEAQAIEAYTQHELWAAMRGDEKTRKLFNHIRNEEQEHFQELKERLEELS